MIETAALQNRAWTAGIASRRIFIPVAFETPEGEIKIRKRPLDLLYVVIQRADDEIIPFFVARRNGQVTLSDAREMLTGTAGTAGLWNSRAPQKRGRRRVLTPTAWIAEVARLIGTERAAEILHLLNT